MRRMSDRTNQKQNAKGKWNLRVLETKMECIKRTQEKQENEKKTKPAHYRTHIVIYERLGDASNRRRARRGLCRIGVLAESTIDRASKGGLMNQKSSRDTRLEREDEQKKETTKKLIWISFESKSRGDISTSPAKNRITIDAQRWPLTDLPAWFIFETRKSRHTRQTGMRRRMIRHIWIHSGWCWWRIGTAFGTGQWTTLWCGCCQSRCLRLLLMMRLNNRWSWWWDLRTNERLKLRIFR